MSYAEAIFLVALGALGGALGSLLVGGRIDAETRHKRRAVADPVLQLVGIMFSVLLAFVFSEVWGEFNIAAQAISEECGALHGAAMLAAALPGGRGRQVIVAEEAYVRSVIGDEYPAMERRLASARTNEAQRQALQQAAQLPLSATGNSAATENEIIVLLAEGHAARETRLFQVTQGLPLPVWIVLDGLSLVLIASVVFSGLEGRAHTPFAAAFAAFIVMVLVLVSMFDYPFQGAMALGDGDYLKVLGQLRGLLTG